MAYVPWAFVTDALRIGWCGVGFVGLTHHCEWSQVMWRCDCCAHRRAVPIGMSPAVSRTVPAEAVEVPVDAGCWSGSAP
jgi:hypothetical protein